MKYLSSLHSRTYSIAKLDSRVVFVTTTSRKPSSFTIFLNLAIYPQNEKVWWPYSRQNWTETGLVDERKDEGLCPSCVLVRFAELSNELAV